jgi:hydroxypyruvate isomerase
MSNVRENRPDAMSRRAAVAATAAASAALLSGVPTNAAWADTTEDALVVPNDFRITKNRIRQSVMGWCFNPMPVPELIDHCASIGIEAIEGIDPKFYPAARDKGLKIALVSSHGFATGPVDPKHHEVCIRKLKSSIDIAVEFGAPSVITFTGMRVPGMEDSVAEQNCLDCWKQVIDYAESRKVTLVLEHLNSRDNSHPMKGHPGYFGDDVERCVDLVQRMNSPHFRLLFDIYHVQIMHGDIIRRIQQHHALIGHYHTAGNPGRNELDDTQEIKYPAVLNAIVATGYRGFVAQEFIPAWKDPVMALRHAAMVSDV